MFLAAGNESLPHCREPRPPAPAQHTKGPPAVPGTRQEQEPLLVLRRRQIFNTEKRRTPQRQTVLLFCGIAEDVRSGSSGGFVIGGCSLYPAVVVPRGSALVGRRRPFPSLVPASASVTVGHPHPTSSPGDLPNGTPALSVFSRPFSFLYLVTPARLPQLPQVLQERPARAGDSRSTRNTRDGSQSQNPAIDGCPYVNHWESRRPCSRDHWLEIPNGKSLDRARYWAELSSGEGPSELLSRRAPASRWPVASNTHVGPWGDGCSVKRGRGG